VSYKLDTEGELLDLSEIKDTTQGSATQVPHNVALHKVGIPNEKTVTITNHQWHPQNNRYYTTCNQTIKNTMTIHISYLFNTVIISKWFSMWATWPPGGHTKFLRSHRRNAENYGSTVTFE
jgi:hypothetical protein